MNRRVVESARPAVLLVAVVTALATVVGAQSLYVPIRVFDSHRRAFSDLETLAAAVSQSGVVFVGEEHDDLNTHRVERTLLEAILRRRADAVLSLEMFERDAQEALAHFSMGHIDEAEFLSAARPWPQYARDYKPLVDFAIDHNWPVVAANVPRDLAAQVAKDGLSALGSRPERENAWFAHDLRCAPTGRYFTRFRDAMSGHEPSAPAMDDAAMTRFYASQCLKDETMAESIAQSYAAGSIGGKHPLVISINGAFHSDYGEGTVERTRRRLKGTPMLVVTILPVGDLDAVKPAKDARARADFLIYTIGRKT